MISMRLACALAIAIALSACQQPGAGTQGSAAVKDDALSKAFAAEEAKRSDAYAPSPWFKSKIKEVTLKLTDRVLTLCLDEPNEDAMNACFHERLLAGFDRDGALKAHCPQPDDVGDDLVCIMVGGMGHELASKIGADAVAAFDWTDPEEAAHDAMKDLVLQEIRNCLSSGSASDPFECFMGRITKTLDLTSSDLDHCTELKDDDYKFGNCVGETYGYKYMSAGIARM